MSFMRIVLTVLLIHGAFWTTSAKCSNYHIKHKRLFADLNGDGNQETITYICYEKSEKWAGCIFHVSIDGNYFTKFSSK